MDTKVTHEENQLNCFLLMVILIVLLQLSKRVVKCLFFHRCIDDDRKCDFILIDNNLLQFHVFGCKVYERRCFCLGRSINKCRYYLFL